MPEKFDRCVKHVKEQGGNVNPYAVCHASFDKEFTKEDQNKLSQILKELKETSEMLKGGEGSGKVKENPFKAFEDAKRASQMKPVKPIKTKNMIRR